MQRILYQHRQIKAIPLAGLKLIKARNEYVPKLSWWTGELKELLPTIRSIPSYYWPRDCRRCGAAYMPMNRQRPAGFCSTNCQKAHQNELKRARQKDYRPSRAVVHAYQPIDCAHCTFNFLPKRSDAVYCSTNCRVQAHNRRKKLNGCEEQCQ
jgi:hypothetical protein